MQHEWTLRKKNSLKMRKYLLPFGFEKADLLLGEVFKTKALAEVSLESRKRRNNNNKDYKRKVESRKRLTDVHFGENNTRIGENTHTKWWDTLNKQGYLNECHFLTFSHSKNLKYQSSQEWLSCGFQRLKHRCYSNRELRTSLRRLYHRKNNTNNVRQDKVPL